MIDIVSLITKEAEDAKPRGVYTISVASLLMM